MAHDVTLCAMPFLLASSAVFVIAALTVGSQVVKVAMANPVEALRYE